MLRSLEHPDAPMLSPPPTRRGLVEVMAEVRRLASSDPATSVLFLTPCHATPYYSHVHLPIPMRFLDCSPPGG